ncbi:MAG: hypothetical protein GXO23_03485 [Crenarchaeota archaeon]|nr:hypothetical protein [Thermoproteota archaeon]
MKEKIALATVLTIFLLLLTTSSIVHAQQNTTTYYIEQIEVKTKNSTKIYTVYIPEEATNYTVDICNVYGNITILLSNYSSFAISKIRFLTVTGKRITGRVTEYYLRKARLHVPSYVRCVEISLRRSNLYDNFGIIVEGISQEFVLNNNKINITTSLFPRLMIFNRKLGKLLFYKVCIVSVAPINVTMRPSYFTMMIYEKHESTLYETCYKTYEKEFEIGIEGTAIVNVTAYYIISSGKKAEKLRNVEIVLAREITDECDNVEICNSTYCGTSIIGREKGMIFLTVNNIAVRAYYLDSVLDGKIRLTDSVVPLSSVALVDSNGAPLTVSELGRNVRILLQGPVTVTYGPHICAVEGYYKAVLKIGNITYDLGTIYLMPGSEIRLPFKKLEIRVILGGLCREKCRIEIYTCGRSHSYLITPENTTFKMAYLEYCKETPLPVALYMSSRIRLDYTYYGDMLLVNACLSRIVVNVKDMLGFPINAIVYVDGRICSRSCIVTCGTHTISVNAYGVNETREIYVNGSVRTVDIRINVLGYKSMIVMMFIIAVIVALVALATRPWRARKREKRKRRSTETDEDVIEIS